MSIHGLLGRAGARLSYLNNQEGENAFKLNLFDLDTENSPEVDIKVESTNPAAIQVDCDEYIPSNSTNKKSENTKKREENSDKNASKINLNNKNSPKVDIKVESTNPAAIQIDCDEYITSKSTNENTKTIRESIKNIGETALTSLTTNDNTIDKAKPYDKPVEKLTGGAIKVSNVVEKFGKILQTKAIISDVSDLATSDSNFKKTMDEAALLSNGMGPGAGAIVAMAATLSREIYDHSSDKVKKILDKPDVAFKFKTPEDYKKEANKKPLIDFVKINKSEELHRKCKPKVDLFRVKTPEDYEKEANKKPLINFLERDKSEELYNKYKPDVINMFKKGTKFIIDEAKQFYDSREENRKKDEDWVKQGGRPIPKSPGQKGPNGTSHSSSKQRLAKIPDHSKYSNGMKKIPKSQTRNIVSTAKKASSSKSTSHSSNKRRLAKTPNHSKYSNGMKKIPKSQARNIANTAKKASSSNKSSCLSAAEKMKRDFGFRTSSTKHSSSSNSTKHTNSSKKIERRKSEYRAKYRASTSSSTSHSRSLSSTKHTNNSKKIQRRKAEYRARYRH